MTTAPKTAHHETTHRDRPPVPTDRAPRRITVTRDGFEPQRYVAKVDEPVEWVNESGNAVVIEFSRSGPDGSIPPQSSPELTEASPRYHYTFIVPGAYRFHLRGAVDKHGVVFVL